MSAQSADEQHLQRALELARQGIGLASPNPHVGAVIADQQGTVVGTGTYTYAGQPYDLDNIAAAKEVDYASAVVRAGAGETLSGPVPR